MCTTTRRRGLPAGGGALGHATPPEAGPPPGGVASPRLANLALDGMERRGDGEDTRGNPQRPSWQTGQNTGRSLSRYADALGGVAPAREVRAPQVLPTLAAGLRGRGRQRSAANTRMVQSTAGFHVLGFESKRDKRARLTPPQKAQVDGHDRTMKTSLKQPRQRPAVPIRRGLPPPMRGWANSDRHGAAQRACRNMDHRGWHARWQWAKRRHPTKSAPWVHPRYFRTVGNRQGVCAEGQAHILW